MNRSKTIEEVIKEIAVEAVREEFARILTGNALNIGKEINKETEKKENDNELLGGVPKMAETLGIPAHRMRMLLNSGSFDDIIKRGGKGNSKIWIMKSDLLQRVKELDKI